MGIFDQLFERHHKHGKRYRHGHHHHDDYRYGGHGRHPDGDYPHDAPDHQQAPWDRHAGAAYRHERSHFERYAPYLHWLARHPGVLLLVGLTALALIAVTLVVLLPIAMKLFGFVAQNGFQGVLNQMWYGSAT